MNNGAEGRNLTKSLTIAWRMLTRPFYSTWWPWTTTCKVEQVCSQSYACLVLTVLIILARYGGAIYSLDDRSISDKKKAIDAEDIRVQNWVGLFSFWKDITIQVRIGSDWPFASFRLSSSGVTTTSFPSWWRKLKTKVCRNLRSRHEIAYNRWPSRKWTADPKISIPPPRGHASGCFNTRGIGAGSLAAEACSGSRESPALGSQRYYDTLSTMLW